MDVSGIGDYFTFTFGRYKETHKLGHFLMPRLEIHEAAYNPILSLYCIVPRKGNNADDPFNAVSVHQCLQRTNVIR
jgi:hypothetical protein